MPLNINKKNYLFFMPKKPVCFQRNTAKVSMAKGWYMINYQIISESPQGELSLSFYNENEKVEDKNILLPHNNGRITKRLCYLSNKASSIVVDTSENQNEFIIEFFEMSRVSKWFSEDRMLKKVTNKHPSYRGISPKKLKNVLESESKIKKINYLQLLYTLYNKCFEAAFFSSGLDFRANPSLIVSIDGNLAQIKVDNKLAERPKAPDWTAFEILSSRTVSRQNPILDVIIPVYNGYDDTLSCVYSVLTSNCTTPYELIVIDDCSPLRELSAFLLKLSKIGLITYLKNTENLGFVQTANIGMKLHEDRDVLLLNSDTIVYPYWLDRLAAHARHERVATVTPLSNNATICSYPYEHQNNQDELEISFSELDRLASSVNKGHSIEIPTAIGFCMYIRRKSINKFGLFDHKSFVKGYGEENDFCMRAMKNGYKNLFALDVFVRHTGEVSFSSEAKKLQAAALQILLKKHPDYMSIVKDYIKRKPAKPYRRDIDAVRLNRATNGRSVLFVKNSRGGGIYRYIKDRETKLNSYGVGVITLSPMIVNTSLAYINTLDPLIVPNLCGIDLVNDIEELSDYLIKIGIESISINSLVDWSFESIYYIQKLAELTGVAYEFIVHDYTSICPLITMTNGTNYFCGDPSDRLCKKCLRKKETSFGQVDISKWRGAYANLLHNAKTVIAPSKDAAQRIKNYYPDIPVNVQPHNEIHKIEPLSIASQIVNGEIRIALIGAIGSHKGSNVLLSCAKNAYKKRLPLKFIIVGYTNMDGAFGDLPNVEMTGPYQENDVFDILKNKQCHAAFFPSVCPETYCYTLSIAMQAGLPCISFDIGAQAERLREDDNALILSTEYVNKPNNINKQIIKYVKQRILQ